MDHRGRLGSPMTAPSWIAFLDRDGVLTDAPIVDGVAGSARRPGELLILGGAAEAVRALHAAGAVVIVVTNQPDVARGLLSPAHLEEMHLRLVEVTGVDEVVVCPHTGDGCACRKPRPGMLVDAAHRRGLSLDTAWMVGDRWVDIAAGASAGTRTALVEREHSWRPTSAGVPPLGLTPDLRAPDLLAAVGLILHEAGGGVTYTSDERAAKGERA